MIIVLIMFLIIIYDIDGMLTWYWINNKKGQEINKIWKWLFKKIGIVPTLFIGRFFFITWCAWIYLSVPEWWVFYTILAISISVVVVRNYIKMRG
jgi:hypothetical protein